MQFGTASCTAACSRRTRNGPLLMIIGVDFHPSLASSRSVFRFLTRWASISAGSPIHNSKSSSDHNRSNQRNGGGKRSSRAPTVAGSSITTNSPLWIWARTTCSRLRQQRTRKSSVRYRCNSSPRRNQGNTVSNVAATSWNLVV